MQTVSNENNEPRTAKQETAPNQTWVPQFNRRQSWNQQDRKHEMQERLIQVEQGRESGFSESAK